jgi:hypothetical protein
MVILAPRYDDYFVAGQHITTAEVGFFEDGPMRMRIREDHRAADLTFEGKH